MALPVYVVESISGADHEQHFVVRCLVEALKLDAVGEGASRRRAEQAAALKLLGQMQV
jgi:ribonuclease-3